MLHSNFWSNLNLLLHFSRKRFSIFFFWGGRAHPTISSSWWAASSFDIWTCPTWRCWANVAPASNILTKRWFVTSTRTVALCMWWRRDKWHLHLQMKSFRRRCIKLYHLYYTAGTWYDHQAFSTTVFCTSFTSSLSPFSIAVCFDWSGPPSNSDIRDYCMFSRESGTKPLFAIVTGWGSHPMYLFS